MQKPSTQHARLLMALLGTALLSACGGGGSSAPSAVPAPVTLTTPPTAGTTTPGTPNTTAPVLPTPPTTTTPPTTSTPPSTNPPGTSPPITPPPPPAPLPPEDTLVVPGANVVTDIRFQSTGVANQSNLPVTFGQAFAIGHVSSAQSLTGRLADGSTVPLQMDVKARHPDGSVRHAVISTKLPALAVSQTLVMALTTVSTPAGATPSFPTALLDAGFSAAVNVDLGNVRYTASADALLRSGNYKIWLAGPFANEWLVSTPLLNPNGVPHPHLSARFAIRAIPGVNQARVDVTVENNWAYEPGPQNFTYDAQVMVGGQSVFTKAALTHNHHARWRKVFWWGAQPAIYTRHNVSYLLATRALPNFDRRVTFTESQLASWKTRWSGPKTELMATGLAIPYMETTGGRDDIGLLPAWAATYLLSMDKRAHDATMGTADLAGSWSSHYRDRNTDRPVSVLDFPYMTIYGQVTDTFNPVTKKQEAFPLCATPTGCDVANRHDGSHQPSFAYLPYLVTGDYFYLEELQFWAMWDVFMSNPGYREHAKGLVKSDQVRGQAWSLRTLGEAAYITPDADPLKAQFTGFVNNNLDWYNANYTNSASTNQLGILTHGYALAYDNSTGVAPWMDDFFTSAIGHLVEMGFSKAVPLLTWKAKFPIERMTAPGTCWVTGAMYAMKVRDSASSPLYTTVGQAWAASSTPTFAAMPCGGSAMATSLSLKVGEMTGYSSANTGFPSNMQPALAYAADAGGQAGAAAWAVFMARSVKPDYGVGPQFAIVPR
jgi:hypothetical protein